MRQFDTINILDMLGAIGEAKLQQCLSDFSCPINPEIEQFVVNTAIEFARKKLSVTYFVVNEHGKIAAVFTLAHKAIEIGSANLSNSKRKKISRYATLDSESDSYTVSAFLIAQFGKNYAVDGGKGINGNELMDLTFEKALSRRISGSKAPYRHQRRRKSHDRIRTCSDTLRCGSGRTGCCGKYRFNDLDLGEIGGLPRIMDIGQCNDAYSAIQVASALTEAFGCGINELPLSFVLSWYEQKAVCILLTLLHLGIQNIRLGPSLPAFLSPNILNFLVEKYGIAPITTPEKDLRDLLGH